MSAHTLFDLGIGCFVVGMLAGAVMLVWGLSAAADREPLFPGFDAYRAEQDDERAFAERFAAVCDEIEVTL